MRHVRKASLLDIHRQQLRRGVSLQPRQLEVIHAVGGIDKVVTAMLESQADVLSTLEMANLRTIITTPSTIRQPPRDPDGQKDNKEDQAANRSLTIFSIHKADNRFTKNLSKSRLAGR